MTSEMLIVTNRPSRDKLFPGSVRDLLSPHQAASYATAANLFIDNRPESVLVDLDAMEKEGQRGYPDFLKTIRHLAPKTKVILLSQSPATAEHGELCLNLPTTSDAIHTAIASSSRTTGSIGFTSPLMLPDSAGYPTMIRTRSSAMFEVLDKIALVAATDTTVLLTGETGTGKGVIARLIHDSSNRNCETMLSVHCGAIPEPLIESELFGHEKGSFTGAIKTKKGKFEQASKGTIFLDEIGTTTAAIQIKLLQVLQDRTFQPIGSNRTLTTDVRIIAASNSDLGEMASRGEFRTDLFYRLNIFPVEIPPLRRRKEDIPLFISYFLDQFNAKHGKQIQGLTDEVLRVFEQYSWPGNVRELENLLERACILADTNYLDQSLFPPDLFTSKEVGRTSTATLTDLKTLAETRNEAVRKAEIEYLCTLLSLHEGKIEASARTAGVSRRQIHKLLTKYNIKKEAFKVKNGSHRFS